MGLALAGSIALGYSNCYVTSPAPDNVATLFAFIIKGLEALDYKVCEWGVHVAYCTVGMHGYQGADGF